MTHDRVLFAFGLHNHQPVGNFDFVFEEAYQKAYLPFLEVLEKFETLRVSQHFTGILLDWFEAHHPEFVDRLGNLVESGRIELLSGGYYEPILVMLPWEDAVDQIGALTDRIAKRFGTRPKGAWVAERVWEPTLARLLADVGLEFALLDDAHFRMAGVPEERLIGPFVTEDQGRSLTVFPIDQKLRYLIPFHPIEETIDELRLLQGRGALRIVVDDGEKFGIWPGTYDSVYGEGWLEAFFTRLEAESDWLHSVTLSEARSLSESQGLVYLPTASYSEMMDWALPYQEGQAIEDFRASLPDETRAQYGRFIKGGFWRSYLSKYREVQQMHRKMLKVSESVKLAADGAEDLSVIRSHLGAAQCNCGYWHGVFGGIYLNHIRSENYHHLIAAETELRKVVQQEPYEARLSDFFRDGGRALEAVAPESALLFDLEAGATLVEWDHISIARNLVNTLTRRPETYHRKILAFHPEEDNAGTASIHELVRLKEPDLAKHLIYDSYRRACNIHLFFPLDLSLGEFLHGDPNRFFHSGSSSFEAACELSDEGVRITITGKVHGPSGGTSMGITQIWSSEEDGKAWYIQTHLVNVGESEWEGWYGLEWGWSLNAGNTYDRYYLINGESPLDDKNLASVGETDGVQEVSLVEEWWGIEISAQFEREARLWRFPIETVSSSEAGFERTYQSSVIVPSWRVRLAPGDSETISMRIVVSDRSS